MRRFFSRQERVLSVHGELLGVELFTVVLKSGGFYAEKLEKAVFLMLWSGCCGI